MNIRCRLEGVGRLREDGVGVGVAEKGRIDMGRNGREDKEMSQEGDEGGGGVRQRLLTFGK